MIKIPPGAPSKFIPNRVWKSVLSQLESNDNGAGEVEVAPGWVLKYEYWTDDCMDTAYLQKASEIKKRAHAEAVSKRLIQQWSPEEFRGDYWIDGGGYLPQFGTYGVTWEVFESQDRNKLPVRTRSKRVHKVKSCSSGMGGLKRLK